MKKYISILIILFLNSLIFSAEYSPEEAIEKAFRDNNEINKINTVIEENKLEYKKTKKDILPKLDYKTSYTKLNEDISFSNVDIKDSDHLYSNEISFEQPVYTGGALSNKIYISKLQNEISLLSLKGKKREIKMRILNSYMSILKSIKSRNIMENALNEMNSNYKKIDDRVKLGLIQRKPLLEFKYRILEIRSNIVSINHDIEIQKLRLKTAIGVADEDDFSIKDIQIPEINIESIDLNSDIDYALSNKNIIKKLNIAKKISMANEKIKLSALLPKVAFNFNYELYGYENGDSNSNTWNAGLYAKVNIFDFGSNLDEIKKSKKETEEKDFDINIAQDKIKIAVKASYFELLRLKDMIEIKTEALESAKENYRIEKQKFDLELSTSSDLLEAENDFRDTDIELINTKIDLYLSYLRYEHLIEKEDL